jgi:hypothetical protein
MICDARNRVRSGSEVFPLVCPLCGGAMRIIAFITDGPTVRDILMRSFIGGSWTRCDATSAGGRILVVQTYERFG